MKKILILGIAILILSMFVVSCDNGNGGGNITIEITNSYSKDVEKVRISSTVFNGYKEYSVFIPIGETRDLKVEISKVSAINKYSFSVLFDFVGGPTYKSCNIQPCYVSSDSTYKITIDSDGSHSHD